MEKGKNLFQELEPEARLEALAGYARKTETQQVRRYYSSDEKDQMKDFVTSESISLIDKKEEFKAIKKEFDTAIKATNDGLIGCLKDIKRGYRDTEEKVFLVDDQENGEMHAYDSLGNYISSRPLRPEERQSRIVNMPATGTHD